MNPFGVFITILVFFVFNKIYEKKKKFYLNPVLLSIIAVIIVLQVTGIDYEAYNESAQVISFFLGPGVVSLAVPLYKKRENVKEYILEVSTGVIVGGLTAVLSVVVITWLLGGSESLIISISPKSVTTPVAISISEQIGGIYSLTAILVIITGILGNSVGVPILNLFKVKDPVARGIAMGVSSHVLGTERIMQESKLSGAISGLGMALNAIFSAFIIYHVLQILPII